MATVWRQENREKENGHLQMHTEPGFQRYLQFQCAMGENQRMLFRCYGHGL
jgi:hypothetical protein